MTHADLIARLEAAPEGSREMSDDYARALGWVYGRVSDIIAGWNPTFELPSDRITGWKLMWKPPSGRISTSAPDFTRSVDAALSAVPTGWKTFDVIQQLEPATWKWTIALPTKLIPVSGWRSETGKAVTAPLALCVAILRAMASDSKGE